MPVGTAHAEDVRVLVVEDEPLVSMLLIDLVEDAGFTVAGSAASTRDALRIARAEQPSIAIVDVNLRGARDGLKAAAELTRSGVSIIFVSGHSDVAEWAEVRALAPVAVLPKPCAPAQVIEALHSAAKVGARAE